MLEENAFCDSGSSPPDAPERFVSADEAAQFVSVKRRYLLALAREGLPGAYALGTGKQRRIWVFRLSELANAITAANRPAPKSSKCVTIRSGSLHAEKRKV
jgi:hypothetical protein